MKKSKIYDSPEFEIIEIKLTQDILGASQEQPSSEEPLPSQSEIDPTDPFGW